MVSRRAEAVQDAAGARRTASRSKPRKSGRASTTLSKAAKSPGSEHGGERDDAHPGAPGRLDAERRVLEHEAAGRRDAELLRRVEEDVGMRLSAKPERRRDDRLEAGAQGQGVEHQRDVRRRRRGRERQAQAAILGGVEEVGEPVHGLDPGPVDLAVDGLLDLAEARHLVRRALGIKRGDDLGVGAPGGAGEEGVRVVRQSLALVPSAPGLPVGAHVVHDRPVHVEDQGLDRLAHARAPLSRFGRCSLGRAGANRSGGGSATRRRPERSTAGTKALVKGRSALGPPAAGAISRRSPPP